LRADVFRLKKKDLLFFPVFSLSMWKKYTDSPHPEVGNYIGNVTQAMMAHKLTLLVTNRVYNWIVGKPFLRPEFGFIKLRPMDVYAVGARLESLIEGALMGVAKKPHALISDCTVLVKSAIGIKWRVAFEDQEFVLEFLDEPEGETLHIAFVDED